MKEKYFNNNTTKIVCIDCKLGIYDIYVIEDWTYYKLEKRIYNALSFDDAFNKFRQPERNKWSKQLKMTLQDAIEHLNDTLSDNNRKWCNNDCKNEHIQLRDWLIELQERRLKDENQTD